MADADRKNQITVTAPINIALVKYWGKRDTNLMLPLNDSISIGIDSLVAKTTVIRKARRDDSTLDKVTVNGIEMDLSGIENRYRRCFEEIRRACRKRKAESETPEKWDFEVISTTNFPTSAGLASSAAGFGALAYGFGKLFDLGLDDIARIAMLGSGSACRSVYSGFVYWEAGVKSDGTDCICKIFKPADYWSNLRAVIAVTSDNAKTVSSTAGMQLTVDTSDLYETRVKCSVPRRLRDLKAAIEVKDFPSFGEIVMRDSNQLHAVCMDSWPPMLYLSDASRHLMHIVTEYNRKRERICVAYTFDAGPNCCMILEEETLSDFLPYLCYYCKPKDFCGSNEKFILGLDEEEILRGARDMTEFLDGVEVMHDSVQNLVVSEVGGGPEILENR